MQVEFDERLGTSSGSGMLDAWSYDFDFSQSHNPDLSAWFVLPIAIDRLDHPSVLSGR
jgi:hypothetical protein